MAGSTGLHLILPWRRDMDPVATFGHSPFPRWYKPLAYHSRRRITHIEAAFTANALIGAIKPTTRDPSVEASAERPTTTAVAAAIRAGRSHAGARVVVPTARGEPTKRSAIVRDITATANAAGAASGTSQNIEATARYRDRLTPTGSAHALRGARRQNATAKTQTPRMPDKVAVADSAAKRGLCSMAKK